MPALRTTATLVLSALAALLLSAAGADAASYKRPPRGQDQWYWQIGPARPGLAGLPPTTGPYPQPGSANIWDTDLFQDSNTANAGIPTARSPVVNALHSAGKYSICYVEAGAYQTSFPDKSNFARADYGDKAPRYRMRGYPNEWWFDIAGFVHYVAGDNSTLTGVARDIAAGLDKRIRWCALEGQDAIEPDDLDGYTNKGDTGVSGGGWHLTRSDSAGFERWLAHDAHSHGLAIFQKNDPANGAADVGTYDGMIIEECNYYKDPCSGPGGDATRYLGRANRCSTPSTPRTARRRRSSAQGTSPPASPAPCSTLTLTARPTSPARRWAVTRSRRDSVPPPTRPHRRAGGEIHRCFAAAIN